MKEDIELNNAIYMGMNIFDSTKEWFINAQKTEYRINDIKYLSLYLGILNTDNYISKKFKELNYDLSIKFNVTKIDKNKYLDIYDKVFFNILDISNINSFDEYVKFILNQDIIKRINQCANIDINELFSSKKLVKTR